MDCVITNKQKRLYIKLDKGKPVTCSSASAQRFEESKAKNILDSLPKPLRRLGFSVEFVPEITPKVIPNDIALENNVIGNESGYQPSKEINRWIDDFGKCGDIIAEAEIRKEELKIKQSELDKELSDLLHIIEIERSKDLYTGWKIYKKIRENRIHRREVKDELLIIQNVLGQVKDPEAFRRDHVKRAVDGLSHRKYTLRIVETEE